MGKQPKIIIKDLIIGHTYLITALGKRSWNEPQELLILNKSESSVKVTIFEQTFWLANNRYIEVLEDITNIINK